MAAFGPAGAVAGPGPQRGRLQAARVLAALLFAVAAGRILGSGSLVLAACASLALAAAASVARRAASALLPVSSASLHASLSRGVELRLVRPCLSASALNALSAALPAPLRCREAGAVVARVTWRGGRLAVSLEGAAAELEVRSQPLPTTQRRARDAAEAAAAATLRRAKLAALRRRLQGTSDEASPTSEQRTKAGRALLGRATQRVLCWAVRATELRLLHLRVRLAAGGPGGAALPPPWLELSISEASALNEGTDAAGGIAAARLAEPCALRKSLAARGIEVRASCSGDAAPTPLLRRFELAAALRVTWRGDVAAAVTARALLLAADATAVRAMLAVAAAARDAVRYDRFRENRPQLRVADAPDAWWRHAAAAVAAERRALLPPRPGSINIIGRAPPAAASPRWPLPWLHCGPDADADACASDAGLERAALQEWRSAANAAAAAHARLWRAMPRASAAARAANAAERARLVAEMDALDAILAAGSGRQLALLDDDMASPPGLTLSLQCPKLALALRGADGVALEAAVRGIDAQLAPRAASLAVGSVLLERVDASNQGARSARRLLQSPPSGALAAPNGDNGDDEAPFLSAQLVLRARPARAALRLRLGAASAVYDAAAHDFMRAFAAQAAPPDEDLDDASAADGPATLREALLDYAARHRVAFVHTAPALPPVEVDAAAGALRLTLPLPRGGSAGLEEALQATLSGLAASSGRRESGCDAPRLRLRCTAELRLATALSGADVAPPLLAPATLLADAAAAGTGGSTRPEVPAPAAVRVSLLVAGPLDATLPLDACARLRLLLAPSETPSVPARRMASGPRCGVAVSLEVTVPALSLTALAPEAQPAPSDVPPAASDAASIAAARWRRACAAAVGRACLPAPPHQPPKPRAALRLTACALEARLRCAGASSARGWALAARAGCIALHDTTAESDEHETEPPLRPVLRLLGGFDASLAAALAASRPSAAQRWSRALFALTRRWRRGSPNAALDAAAAPPPGDAVSLSLRLCAVTADADAALLRHVVALARCWQENSSGHGDVTPPAVVHEAAPPAARPARLLLRAGALRVTLRAPAPSRAPLLTAAAEEVAASREADRSGAWRAAVSAASLRLLDRAAAPPRELLASGCAAPPGNTMLGHAATSDSDDDIEDEIGGSDDHSAVSVAASAGGPTRVTLRRVALIALASSLRDAAGAFRHFAAALPRPTKQAGDDVATATSSTPPPVPRGFELRLRRVRVALPRAASAPEAILLSASRAAASLPGDGGARLHVAGLRASHASARAAWTRCDLEAGTDAVQMLSPVHLCLDAAPPDATSAVRRIGIELSGAAVTLRQAQLCTLRGVAGSNLREPPAFALDEDIEPYETPASYDTPLLQLPAPEPPAEDGTAEAVPPALAADAVCSLTVDVRAPQASLELLLADDDSGDAPLARLCLDAPHFTYRDAGQSSALEASAAAGTLYDLRRLPAGGAPYATITVPPDAADAAPPPLRVCYTRSAATGDASTTVAARGARGRWPYGADFAFPLALASFFAGPDAVPGDAKPSWMHWSVAISDGCIFAPLPRAAAQAAFAPPFTAAAADARGLLLTWREAAAAGASRGPLDASRLDTRLDAAALALRDDEQHGQAGPARHVTLAHPAGFALQTRRRGSATQTALHCTGELLLRVAFSQAEAIRDLRRLLRADAAAAPSPIMEDALTGAPCADDRPAGLPPDGTSQTAVWRLSAPRVRCLLRDDRRGRGGPDVASAAAHSLAVSLAVERGANARRSSLSARAALELHSFSSALEAMLPALERWPVAAEAEDERAGGGAGGDAAPEQRRLAVWAGSAERCSLVVDAAAVQALADVRAFAELLHEDNADPVPDVPMRQAGAPLYRLQNLTGTRLWYWLERAPLRGGSRESFSDDDDGFAEEIGDEGHQGRGADVACVLEAGATAALALRGGARRVRLAVQLSGSFAPVRGIALHASGARRHAARSLAPDGAPLPLVAAVALAGRRRTLRLHSGLRVVNTTDAPLTLWLDSPRAPAAQAGAHAAAALQPVPPGGGAAWLPLAAALPGASLAVQALGFAPARAQAIRVGAALEDATAQQGILRCPPLLGDDSGGTTSDQAAFFCALQVVTEAPPAASGAADADAAGAALQLIFRPAFAIENALPYDVRIEIGDRDAGTTHALRIAAGASAHVAGADPRHDLWLAAAVPSRGLATRRAALVAAPPRSRGGYTPRTAVGRGAAAAAAAARAADAAVFRSGLDFVTVNARQLDDRLADVIVLERAQPTGPDATAATAPPAGLRAGLASRAAAAVARARAVPMPQPIRDAAEGLAFGPAAATVIQIEHALGRQSGARRVALYAPFWIVNRTGRALQVADGLRTRTLPAGGAPDGPAASLPARAAAALPALLSGRGEASLRLRGCAWSERLQLREAGSRVVPMLERRPSRAERMGGGAAAACFGASSDVDADAACDYSEHSHDDSVRTTNASDDSPPSPRVAAAPHAANGAPLPCAEFDLAVAMWPGPAQFVRTKVVTVSLRLLCRNACPFPVQVAQARQAGRAQGLQPPPQTLPAGWLAGIAWADADAPRALTLRPLSAGGTHPSVVGWARSGPFRPGAEARTALRVRRADGAGPAMLLAVDARQAGEAAGAALLLTISPGDDSPAFRVENRCAALHIRFRQQRASAGGDAAAMPSATAAAGEDFVCESSAGGADPSVRRQRWSSGSGGGETDDDGDDDDSQEGFTWLPPGASVPYAWDRPLGSRRVEAEAFRADGSRAASGLLYTLEKVGPRPDVLIPLPMAAPVRGRETASEPRRAYVEVALAGATRVLRFSDAKTRGALADEADAAFAARAAAQLARELAAADAALAARAAGGAAALEPAAAAALRANWARQRAALLQGESADHAASSSDPDAPLSRALRELPAAPPEHAPFLGGTLVVTVLEARGLGGMRLPGGGAAVRAAAGDARAATVPAQRSPGPASTGVLTWQQTLRLEAVPSSAQLRLALLPAEQPHHRHSHRHRRDGHVIREHDAGDADADAASDEEDDAQSGLAASLLGETRVALDVPGAVGAPDAAPGDVAAAPRWHALSRGAGGGGAAPRGELLIALRWEAAGAATDAALRVRLLRAALDARRELLALLAPAPLRPDATALPPGLAARLLGGESSSSSPGIEGVAAQLLRRHVGVLRCGVLAARGVPLPRGRGRTRDCYVRLRVTTPATSSSSDGAFDADDADGAGDGPAFRARTRVVRDSVRPAWDARFEFAGARLSSRLALTLFDDNLIGRGHLGGASLPAACFGDGAPRFAWLPLHRRAPAPPGDEPPALLLRLQFVATGLAPPGAPASAAAAAAAAAAALESAHGGSPPRRLDASIAVALRSVAVSLAHRGREVARLELRGVDATASRDDARDAAALAVRDAQLDNQLPDALAEVILARRNADVDLPRDFDHDRDTETASSTSAAPMTGPEPLLRPRRGEPSAALWASASRRRRGLDDDATSSSSSAERLIALESLLIAPGPFDLNVDEALLDAVAECIAGLSVSNDDDDHADDAAGSLILPAPQHADAAALLAAPLATHCVAAGAGAPPAPPSLYVASLRLGDLRLSATLTTAAARPGAAAFFGARRQLLHRFASAGGFALVDVADSPIALRGVAWTHVLATPAGLAAALRRHAAPQLLRAAAQLLGSVALVGPLADGASALRAAAGALGAARDARGPGDAAAALARAASALGRGALLAVLNGTSRAAGLGASALALATLDASYAARRATRPVNAPDAALRGARELPLALFDAVAGLVTTPAGELWAAGGARWHPAAAAALARGAARGVAHAAFRPPAALLDAVSKEATAGAMALRRAAAGAGGARGRARLPRDFAAEATGGDADSESSLDNGAADAAAAVGLPDAALPDAGQGGRAPPADAPARWAAILAGLGGGRGRALLAEGVVDGCLVKRDRALIFTRHTAAYVDYARGVLRWRAPLRDVASARGDAAARTVVLRTQLRLPHPLPQLPLRRTLRCPTAAAFSRVAALCNRYCGAEHTLLVGHK
jgi:hypothetical protein